MDLINNEKKNLKEIFNRFKKKDFSGNEGQAIKNSSYLFTTTIIAKLGSLLFTIILARMLMPELFGLYSLALGTIVLFTGFSDFGISTAMVTFIAKSLGKGNKIKAKAYFSKLLKLKWIIVGLATFVLLISAYFVANNYYNKPIFFALLTGGLYLPLSSFLGFFGGVFRANNNFRIILIKEIIYQFLRLSLVPLGIFFLLKEIYSPQILIAGIILLLSFCFGISLLFLIFTFKKNSPFKNSKKIFLSKKENKELKWFILPVTFTMLSGTFFGYIDTIMLGHFVESEFIGYYSSAFSLSASIAAIISFNSGALFPIFARMNGKNLEKGFKKAGLITISISLISSILTFLLAKYFILIAYGKEYFTAIPLLQLFCLIVLISPLIGLYETYFVSQERTKIIAFLLVISTSINIVLNLFFINYGLKFGMIEALMGAGIATLISRIIYLGGLGIWKIHHH